MPEEVAFFVAKNVRSNVRELEGALRKILAYSRFNQKEISIQLAREALRDLLSIQNRQIGVENIQKTVADYYKIKVADMYSKKRPASIARPRQIAMYLAKELTQKSLPEIGELFGGRDHTTVLHAVRKIAAERQTVTELNQQLHVLEQTLKGDDDPDCQPRRQPCGPFRHNPAVIHSPLGQRVVPAGVQHGSTPAHTLAGAASA
jgi:chromosomal replication initiator protein